MPTTIYKNSSPYFKTPQANDLVQYMRYMEFRDVTADDGDEGIEVSTKFHERPDLLSNNLYGTPDLWWIFIIRNPDQLIDPIYGLVAGLNLYVPSKQRIFSLLGM